MGPSRRRRRKRIGRRRRKRGRKRERQTDRERGGGEGGDRQRRIDRQADEWTDTERDRFLETFCAALCHFNLTFSCVFLFLIRKTTAACRKWSSKIVGQSALLLHIFLLPPTINCYHPVSFLKQTLSVLSNLDLPF